MNRCRPEQKDTTYDGKMLNVILTSLKKERVSDRSAMGWKVEGEKEEFPGRRARG